MNAGHTTEPHSDAGSGGVRGAGGEDSPGIQAANPATREQPRSRFAGLLNSGAVRLARSSAQGRHQALHKTVPTWQGWAAIGALAYASWIAGATTELSARCDTVELEHRVEAAAREAERLFEAQAITRAQITRHIVSEHKQWAPGFKHKVRTK
jgi:hypothetical protein